MNIVSMNLVQKLQETTTAGSKTATAPDDGFKKLVGRILKAEEAKGSNEAIPSSAPALANLIKQLSTGADAAKEEGLPSALASLLKSLNSIIKDSAGTTDTEKQDALTSTAADEAGNDALAGKKESLDNLGTMLNMLNSILQTLKSQLGLEEKVSSSRTANTDGEAIKTDGTQDNGKAKLNLDIDNSSYQALLDLTSVLQGLRLQTDSKDTKAQGLQNSSKGDALAILQALSNQLEQKTLSSTASAGDNPEAASNQTVKKGAISELLKELKQGDTQVLQQDAALENNPADSLLNNMLSLLQPVSQDTATAETKAALNDLGIETSTKNVLNTLKTLAEFIKANTKESSQAKGGSDSDSGFMQKLKSVIDEIDIAKLSEAVTGDSSTGSSKAGARSIKGVNDFKEKLVELLVRLSKDDSTANGRLAIKDEKADNVQKLMSQLKAEWKELNPDKANGQEKTNPRAKAEGAPVAITAQTKLLDKQQPEAVITKTSLETKAGADKENKILKSIAGTDDSSNSKLNKVNTFMTQLNAAKTGEGIGETQAASAEKPVINRGNLTQDIVKAVKYMNVNDLKELTVKVNPKELGEIVIKLTMNAGEMKASISAHSRETYSLLATNAADLTSSLSTGDLKIQNVDINIYQEDATFYNNNSKQGGQSGEHRRNHRSSTVDEILLAGDQTADIGIPDNNLSILV